MRTYPSTNLVVRIAVTAVLTGTSVMAHAQLASLPGFFEKHFRYEATKDKDNSSLNTQFEYIAGDTLSTSNSLNIKNDGFENHTVVSVAQNFGAAKAKATYKSSQFNYTSGEHQSEDVFVGFQFLSLRMQHQQENAKQVSSVGIPYDLGAVRFDVSIAYVVEDNAAAATNVYNIVSQFNNHKVSTTWQYIGGEHWIDVSSLYRLSKRWLMKLTYADHGATIQQQMRSEFTGQKFRFAGEYISQTEGGVQTHNLSAVYIEKKMKTAVLKMRIGYDGVVASPILFFNIETPFDF